MRRHRWYLSVFMGVASGVLLAFLYVNPYGGVISLQEMVLQLSGSRGEFALGIHLTELVGFMTRMIPGYLFELYFGISFYRQFCAASVYVFSRRPDRIGWYAAEVGALVCNGGLFQIALLAGVCLTTVCRFRVNADMDGVILLGCHFLIYMFWICTMTVLVNILALKWGSNGAFGIVMGIQTVCITLFGCEEMLGRLGMKIAQEGSILNGNPMAGLVLGWHVGAQGRYLLTYGILCVMVVLAGAFVVARHDLLLSDAERGI